jgi:hypothetical protein
VIRWLGGEAEARRARWRPEEGKITTMLLYLLALAGAVIVFLTILVACQPTCPSQPNQPSQRYIATTPEPPRCGDRPPLVEPSVEFSSEDPRFIP